MATVFYIALLVLVAMVAYEFGKAVEHDRIMDRRKG